MAVESFSLIVPYYRNPDMLREQFGFWAGYPAGVQVILVDDGSPEPAIDVIKQCRARFRMPRSLQVLRILTDIPWNRGGARNLGTHVATTPWLVHVDIDHVLSIESAQHLLSFEADASRWYRFRRVRIGRADETRQKDKIPADQEYGEIHPHIDSYLCTAANYWAAGGYDEDYSGCLGGGTPFCRELERRLGPPGLVPGIPHLEVYTRSVVADASDLTLSRDRSEYARRKKLKEVCGKTRGVNPLRFRWRLEDLTNV